MADTEKLKRVPDWAKPHLSHGPQRTDIAWPVLPSRRYRYGEWWAAWNRRKETDNG